MYRNAVGKGTEPEAMCAESLAKINRRAVFSCRSHGELGRFAAHSITATQFR